MSFPPFSNGTRSQSLVPHIVFIGGAGFPPIENFIFWDGGVVKREKRADREERKLGGVEGEVYTKYTKHTPLSIQIAQTTINNYHKPLYTNCTKYYP